MFFFFFFSSQTGLVPGLVAEIARRMCGAASRRWCRLRSCQDIAHGCLTKLGTVQAGGVLLVSL